jgi:acyl-CoA thioester hydrolase
MRDGTGGESSTHELRLKVRSDDIDGLGHVNNVVYLSWIQDVATDHWTTVASPEQIAETVWVVVRHEIDYERPAHAGDDIVVRTWVGEATPTTWARHTEIYRGEGDNRLLVRAKSVYCPLNARSMRPRRLDEALREPFDR